MIECDDNSNPVSHRNDTHTLSTPIVDPLVHQQQPILIGAVKTSSGRSDYHSCDDNAQPAQQQTQQRVHVIKDGRYFYEESISIQNSSAQLSSSDLATIDPNKNPPIIVTGEPKQHIILNRRIIVQPNNDNDLHDCKQTNYANGSSSSSAIKDPIPIEDIQFHALVKKSTIISGQDMSTNLIPASSNSGDTLNVVFRAPIVSSSSSNSSAANISLRKCKQNTYTNLNTPSPCSSPPMMRPPPPPPPPKIKSSEEPSSSIPDLGEKFFFIFLLDENRLFMFF